MDEDLKSLIAAMERVAYSDAKIRDLAAKRRVDRFPGHLYRKGPTLRLLSHQAEDSEA
jgi:hypothetical protein